jgi:hypothetical protein
MHALIGVPRPAKPFYFIFLFIYNLTERSGSSEPMRPAFDAGTQAVS